MRYRLGGGEKTPPLADARPTECRQGPERSHLPVRQLWAVTTATVSVELPSEPASVPSARRLVRQALTEMGQGALADDAELLTTELVTNALLHGREPVRVTVTRHGPGVLVKVHDGNAQLPRRHHYRADATTGRGLALVEAIAAAWGSRVVWPGKYVWFSLEPGASREPAPGLAGFDFDHVEML